MTKKRLDLLLVEKGFAETQGKAQARVLAGEVIVDDKRVDKPGTLIDESAAIRLRAGSGPYVSRGGLKLKAAIDRWPSAISGATCLDIGSSTGGFTDVLLKEGASKVYAVDVGYNQLAFALRQDPRVVVMEKTHVLNLEAASLDSLPSVAVIDVSFISLKRVLPKVAQLIAENGVIYVLIKPQFEVSPEKISAGGIVKDESARLEAVQAVLSLAQNLGLASEGFIESPVQGADGNIEYLTLLRKT